MTSIWQQFSKEMSEVVNRTGSSVVAVDGRSGHTSSGILWRSGCIVTAAHAIRHDANIGVILGPGRTVAARLAGRDRGSDIALLRFDEKLEMEPVHFGSTTSLSVGELTVAVARTRRGNIVASAGIVSGMMGEWQLARTRIDQFIRPDLNLYPGFSGGVLVDAGGEVLGMNTSGLLRGKPVTIPASTLTRIAEELATSGHVSKPFIGLVMQPVQIPESLQKKAGVTTPSGLLVMQVEPDGAANKAGVLLGDILLDMDGRTFADLDDVYAALGEKGPGQVVQTSIIRGGNKLEISVQIGERPSR